MEHNWDFYTVFIGYEGWWLKGLLVTIAYATGTVAGGLVIGVICGMGLLANRWWLTVPIHAYVELFRCTPVLVQIIWFFFALPIIIQVDLPGWLAAGIGLTLYMGCFATEIFRGGIISIDRGQWQAARAIGMTYREMMQHIILPQAGPPDGAALRQPVGYPVQEHRAALCRCGAGHDVHRLPGSGGHLPAAGGLYRVAIAYFILLYPVTQWGKRLEARRDQ